MFHWKINQSFDTREKLEALSQNAEGKNKEINMLREKIYYIHRAKKWRCNLRIIGVTKK